MRKSILVVLLVATLLVVDTEAGWFRRIVNKAKDVVNKAVDKVKDFVDKHKDNIIRVIGKRSAQPPCPPQDDEKRLQQVALLMQKLQDVCPTFGIDANVGLTQQAVLRAFEHSDAGKKGYLTAEELDYFETLLDVFEECVTVELAKRE